MFRIIKDGASIGLTENLNYIKQAENGCYVLCPEPDASGIVLAAPFITCLEEQVWTGLKPSVWKKLMVVWRSSRLLKLVESCS